MSPQHTYSFPRVRHCFCEGSDDHGWLLADFQLDAGRMVMVYKLIKHSSIRFPSYILIFKTANKQTHRYTPLYRQYPKSPSTTPKSNNYHYSIPLNLPNPANHVTYSIHSSHHTRDSILSLGCLGASYHPSNPDPTLFPLFLLDHLGTDRRGVG